MRSLPAFSDTRFSLSFFLITPAKKPRTECCCQSVAFLIAAMVVPFGSRSMAITVSCLDEDGAVAFGDAGFETARSACAGCGRAETLLLAGRFTARGDLRDVF